MNEATPFAPSPGTVTALLTAGIRAPSADNRHHVYFRLHDDGFALHADRSFLDCDVVHRRLLTLISFGAVVENIRLKLTEYGHSFTPRWFPEADDSSLIARVRWHELDMVREPDALARHIDSRHTNRRFFHGPKSSREEIESIEAAARRVPGVALEWFDDQPRRGALLRLTRIAESERFGSEVLHRELFESIDFDAGWMHATPERLAPGSLEIERPLRGIFKALRHWPAMRAVKGVSAHRILGLRAGDLPLRTAPHIGVLTSRLPAFDAALDVGASFERIWLAAEAHGLALQPIVASAALAREIDVVHGLPAKTWETLREGWRDLVGDASPLIVFRLGRARHASIRSGRMPVASYLEPR